MSRPSLIKRSPSSLPLEPGSGVAVIGGGPAGSFFSYFFLETASRIGLQARVDIYDDGRTDELPLEGEDE